MSLLLQQQATEYAKQRRKEHLHAVLEDMAGCDLFYYDRKEDDILPRGAIEEMVANGETSIQEIKDLLCAAVDANFKP